jgi:hypothetical protein
MFQMQVRSDHQIHSLSYNTMDPGTLLLCGTFSSAVHIFVVYLTMTSVAHTIRHQMAEFNK